MPIPQAVLKHWDPMIGVDFHMGLQFAVPVPIPFPMLPHLVGGVLMWGPWGGTSEPTVRTFHGDVMLRGTNMGSLVPHISLPPLPFVSLLQPVWILLSSSKTEFGVASVRCAGGPVAVAGPNPIPFLGANLNCNEPVSMPTGVVLGINTHFAGFTIGDFIAGTLMTAIDIGIGFLLGKVSGKGGLGEVGEKVLSSIVSNILGRGISAVPGINSAENALQDFISTEVNTEVNNVVDRIADSVNDYFNDPAVDERP